MNGIGQLDLELSDLICDPLALSFVIEVPTPPAYLAKYAVSVAFHIILSILSSITLT